MDRIQKRLTASEREVMDILWKSDRPLTSMGIVAAASNKTWKSTSIYILLNSLLKKELIEVAGYERTTKNYARSFKPVLSYEDYVIKLLLANATEEKRKEIILKMVKEETNLDIIQAILEEAKRKLQCK